MFIHDTKIRARYSETDKMGVIHHANYLNYYEIGRTEILRSTGMCSYGEIEREGIFMPVIEVQSNYIAPARYDENLTVKTIMREMPTAKITFHYEIYNEKQEMLNIGKTVLVFVNAVSGHPCRPPKKLVECLSSYFKE